VFYRLGWEPVVDLGWVVAFADPVWPGVEFSLMSHDECGPCAAVSVEVDEVDACVRRFFGRDPGRNVVNVVSRR
jgi:hypothetical protein